MKTKSRLLACGTLACLAISAAPRDAWAVLQDVTTPGDPTFIVPQGSTPPDNEGVENAIDNTTNKYLNFEGARSGFRVSPQFGATAGGTVVTGLRIYTANDEPGRDPISYKLEGSLTGEKSAFTLISQGTLSPSLDRNALDQTVNSATLVQQTVTFANTKLYKHYRLTFPTLRDTETIAMQIAEVELLSDLPLQVTVADDIAPAGSTADFLVTLGAPASKRIEIPYSTADGTAVAGSDYTATSGVVVFEAGEQEKTVSIPVAANNSNEAEENFFLDLTPTTGVQLRRARAEALIPGVLIVTNLNDTGPGSLRRAINQSIRGTIITFAQSLSGVIPLDSGVLDIKRDVIIRGPGNDRITLDSVDGDSILMVNGVKCTISGLSFSNGQAAGYYGRGGAIWNASGNLELRRCNFRDNSGTSIVSSFESRAEGGAIFSESGTLTVKNCAFERNRVSNGGTTGGGAIAVDGGTVLIENSQFRGNSARSFFFSSGGAISINGTDSATIRNCNLQDNTTDGEGGALFTTRCEVYVEQSYFEDNRAAFGGATSTDFGYLQFTDSILNKNASVSDGFAAGGAVYGQDADLFLERCRLRANKVQGPEPGFGSGGAIAHSTSRSVGFTFNVNIYDSVIQGNTATGSGGGVAMFTDGDGSTLGLYGVTLATNKVEATGGGVYVQGGEGTIETELINCTLSGNVASGSNSTGGIVATSSEPEMQVSVTSSTLTANEGTTTGGIRAGAKSNVTLRNSIVASNSGPQLRVAQDGAVSSNGFNLINDASLSNPQPTDLLNTQPGLLPLANNGGFAPTHALTDTSAALDKGQRSGTPFDQRGLKRPFDISSIPNAPNGDGSDIGAFERQKQVSQTTRSTKGS